jgi:hypothetical protein
MKPIDFEYANINYTGGSGGDLPVNRFVHPDGTVMQLSIWRGSLWERLSFLLTGKVYVLVKSEYIPRMAIAAGMEKQIEFEHIGSPTSAQADGAPAPQESAGDQNGEGSEQNNEPSPTA